MVASSGLFFIEFLHFFGSLSLLYGRFVKDALTPPFYSDLLVDQIYQIGVKSIPLVFITALSTGMVITLQFGFGLEKFGGKLYVPKIVALSIIRELGPVFTSLMIAGRVGAGIASEVGSMKVTQQLDAIRALGTSEIKRIVVPRILALIITLPLLTAFANTFGILSGVVVGSSELGLDPTFFIAKVLQTVQIGDYVVGIAKTFFFALFIGLVGCYYGMNVTEGTRGVGIATTKSVVAGSILIVISDFFLTKLFWVFEK